MGDGSLPQHIEDEIYQSRLQIVLLSPTLLQFLSRCPTLPIGRLLHPDRVLAIMLGVKDSLITAEHRSGDWRESIKLTSFKNSKNIFSCVQSKPIITEFFISVLFSFSQWIHLEAKDHDLEFVQTVLYFSTQILQRSDAKRAHRASSVCSNPSSSGRHIHGCRSESNIFSIQPKKLSEVRKFYYLAVLLRSKHKIFIDCDSSMQAIFYFRAKTASWSYLKILSHCDVALE